MSKVNTSIDHISLRNALRDSSTQLDGFVITRAGVAMAVGLCSDDPFVHAMTGVGSAINESNLSFQEMRGYISSADSRML